MVHRRSEKARFLTVIVVLLLSQIVYNGSSEQCAGSVQGAGSSTANISPVVEVIPDVSSGKAPLRVRFDGRASDEDGLILSLEWDFEGDGIFEDALSLIGVERSVLAEAVRLGLKKEFVYTKPGIYHALVRVTDDRSESSTSSMTIQVYSNTPYLDIVPCSSEYAYMARAGYEVFFRNEIDEDSVRFEMRDAWISYQVVDQSLGRVAKVRGTPSGNVILYQNVIEDILRYTVYEDLLLEEFIVNSNTLVFFDNFKAIEEYRSSECAQSKRFFMI